MAKMLIAQNVDRASKKIENNKPNSSWISYDLLLQEAWMMVKAH